jgi:peroxiredoxin
MNLKNHRRWTDETTIKVALKLVADGKADTTERLDGMTNALKTRKVACDERRYIEKIIVIECHKVIESAYAR